MTELTQHRIVALTGMSGAGKSTVCRCFAESGYFVIDCDISAREVVERGMGSLCLGLQLMCRHSEEGNADCLNIFDLDVKRFDDKLKVPQIGWNDLTDLKSDLFKGLPENPYVYFVHGFYAELGENTIAKAEYGLQYSAALNKGNFYATQFHPEKSGSVGETILRNFIELK